MKQVCVNQTHYLMLWDRIKNVMKKTSETDQVGWQLSLFGNSYGNKYVPGNGEEEEDSMAQKKY